jgi:hypothetical protein
MRFFLAAMLFAGAAHGQGFPYHYSVEPDEFSLEVEGDNPSYAYVEYHNSAARSSGQGYPRTLTNGSLTVELRVTIGQGPETLEVSPPRRAGGRCLPILT